MSACSGLTVVLVLHDVNQAARHPDRTVALDEGVIVADGPPAQVVTEQLLREVFRVHAPVDVGPDGIPVATATQWAGYRTTPRSG